MSPSIVILDPEVVNQIAAGEVVERPASVVKELVENALDADARRVDVEVEQGGQRLIRVADDGRGMSPQEVVLSLERHATSKLRCAEDLQSMRSMGFRGEALPSIASVSRLKLVSRPPGAACGFALGVEAGRQLDRGQPAGCRVGTTLEVSDLFFNTPARLKFLKSTATETAHITDTLTQLALANPGVHFTLTVDGRCSLELPPGADRLERARTLLGRRGASLTGGRYEEGDLTVEACLGPPQHSTRSTRSVHLLVNRRMIRDRALIHAVVAGYDTLLERGRFPLAVVHVRIDPSLVDVNVHPQKTEVRFAAPGVVFAAIRRCVRDAVARGDWTGGGVENTRYHMDPPPGGYMEHRSRLEEATRRFWSARARDFGEPSLPASAAEEGGTFSRMRPVGQVLGTYLILEAEDEVVLVDQHAAHERVTFERLRDAWEEGRIPSQGLLIPAEVELDGQLAVAAGERTEELRRLGIELEPFGKAVWMARAVPTWLAGTDPAALVREVLEELVSGGQARAGSGLDSVLACMACHGSVRAGQSLEPEEVQALLSAMDRIDFAQACPHGRPVLVRLTRSELERRFGR